MGSVPKPPFLVKALYPYQSEHEDDLNFQVGQTIKVETIEDEEWFSGSLADDAGKKGMFPRNFVEIVPQPAVPASRPPGRASTSISPQQLHHDAPVMTTGSSAIAAGDKVDDDEEDWSDGAVEQDDEKDMKSIRLGAPTATADIEKTVADLSLTNQADRLQTSSSTVSKEEVDAPIETAKTSSSTTPAPHRGGSSAFKSRIAAFNTQTDAPPVPFGQQAKPTSFVKKPFVAPPPSSYVPSVPPSSSHVKQAAAHASPPVNHHESDGKYFVHKKEIRKWQVR
jgi:hypothetical protein